MNITIWVSLLTAILTSLLARVLYRNKLKAETQKLEADTEKIRLENIEKTVNLWRSFSADLEKQIKQLTERCVLLSTEIERLRSENTTLETQVIKLRAAIEKKVV
ncbi:hypothetical protein SAMN05421788_101826 [Filimonas lacunae]|uniref:Uncharacterized protein n=1 Tax=Filimonas lacunae TaxID=477680 RepID=A0A173MPK7_9BACT|nr:hypothetical protein [Filimonas lacunae]BAV09389.1 hypothetical protein FLA_5437 [Filimonas lacunae]SIS72273.1 hypothetical protein SAMN05421788_101826 [Filimonas lacunae]